MSLALPSLHKLSLRSDSKRPARAEHVAAILDDPEMPPELLERIERLTLDRRRGPDHSNCIFVRWEVKRFQAIKNVAVFLTMRRNNVTRADGQLLRAAVLDRLAERGTPVQQSQMNYFPPPTPPVAFDVRNTIGLAFWVGESATPRRGLTVDVAVALLTQAVDSFAARTNRMIVANPPHSDQSVSVVDGHATTSQELKLCAITPGTPGFLGRVVAKSLQTNNGPPAEDVGAILGPPATSAPPRAAAREPFRYAGEPE